MTIEDELAALARQAGELGPDEDLHPSLLEFAELVAERCARIGDRYGDCERNAGDHIRAVMYEVPKNLSSQKGAIPPA